jgi:hypothetical protein
MSLLKKGVDVLGEEDLSLDLFAQIVGDKAGGV